MIKLYVVRGIGRHYRNWLYVSANYEVTMLRQDTGWIFSEQWLSNLRSAAEICYADFRKQTGIRLAPGEYTAIKIGETKP